MASRRNPPAHEPRRRTSPTGNGRFAATPVPRERSHSSANTRSVVDAPRRTLPPLQQDPADRVGTVQYQTHHTTPQLGTLQRTPYTTQRHSAAQLHAPSPANVSYQSHPVLTPVQGATRTSQNPYSTYPWGSGTGTSQRPASGYPSSYGPSVQNTYMGNNMQPPSVAPGPASYEPRHDEVSRPQLSPVNPFGPFAPSQSKVRQPVPLVGLPQISLDDM